MAAFHLHGMDISSSSENYMVSEHSKSWTSWRQKGLLGPENPACKSYALGKCGVVQVENANWIIEYASARYNNKIVKRLYLLVLAANNKRKLKIMRLQVYLTYKSDIGKNSHR